MFTLSACNIQQQDIEHIDESTVKTKTQVVTNEVSLPTPLTMDPAFLQISTNSEFTFKAFGGTPPYSFSLISGPGSIEVGGRYLSPGAPGDAVVRVTDLIGSTADGLITIDQQLVVSPATKMLNVSTSFTFNVTGGNPPYNFAIASGGASGSINSLGVFTATAVSGQSIIRVTDNRGTIVNATVTVGVGPVISPTTKKIPVNTTFQFNSIGGTPPIKYKIGVGGGSVNETTGVYTAPATPGSATVIVYDGLGYSSEAAIESFVWNQISATYMSTCLLKGNTGEVKCFGSNQQGELGRDGMTVGDDPADMGDNLYPAILATDMQPISVAQSYLGVCGLYQGGLAQCWGYGGLYQDAFGYGDSVGGNSMGDNRPFIPIGAGRTITQIEGGYYQNCALLDNGDVKCWGYNAYGQLGQGDGAYYYSSILYAAPAVILGRPATKIALGIWHSCALLNDGNVKCWGYNGNGELGQDNTTQIGDNPGEMAALSNVNLGVGRTATDIAAGGYHTCVVLDNGHAKCWGYNYYGQLGIGATDSRGDAGGEMAALTEISFAGRTIVKVTAGYYHSCALLDNNAMRCWGYNGHGQLGQGDTVNRGVAPGQMSTIVDVPLGSGRTVKKMAAYGEHTCAILDNDSLKCWGYNNFGQLGLGHLNTIGTDPSQLGDNLPAVDLGTNTIAKDIVDSPDYSNTCAVVERDGVNQIVCWGQVLYGQDGTMRGSVGIRNSDMGNKLVAVNLSAFNGADKVITRGYLGHCATAVSGTGSGTSKCWGYNETSYRLLGSNSAEWAIGDTHGEIGSGIPSLVAGIGVKTLWVEGNDQSPFTCGLFDESGTHTLKCWGYNPYGNLGQDDTNNRTYIPTTPAINLGVGRSAVQFSLGPYSVCARLDNGSVKCWGYNPYGNLGQGHTNNLGDNPGEMAALNPIDLGTGRTAKYVCTNNYHACAILDNDKIKCWGVGDNGQLGYEDTARRGDGPGEMGDALPFVNLGTGRTVKKLSCGVNYNCAILDNDKLKCWGYNGYGQLGLNTTAPKGSSVSTMGDMLPYVDVGTGRTVIDVKASYYHTCALLDTNEVKCWGWNFRGQLGQGRPDTYIGEAPNEMGDNLLPINF